MKRLFIYDFRKEDILTEKKLEKYLLEVEDFPGIADAAILVTIQQKQAIAGFPGNSTRYIPADNEPYCSDRDILVYDAINMTVSILSEGDMKHLGLLDLSVHHQPCIHPKWKTLEYDKTKYVQQCTICEKVEVVRT